MNIYTFPLFSQLPKELRDMIWDCALRPFEHGAHHFSLEESSSRGPPNQHASRALELCSIKSDENVSTYMLTRGLLTACEESRAAVERSRRRAPLTATPGNGGTENTPRIITSKLDGRAQELFYYDSSDIIILRRGWGRTGHIVSDCLAIESDNGQSGASPHFPKHIGLEIDLNDFMWLWQWEYPPTNRGEEYEHFRYFVDSMINWLNHGATLHFIGKPDSDCPWVQREGFEFYDREETVFYDSKHRYIPVVPVLPANSPATTLVGMFIWKLREIFRNIDGPDFGVEMFTPLKGLAQKQILPDKTVA